MGRFFRDLIKQFFSRWFPRKTSADSNLAVILCGPLYDEVTRYTSNWLEGVKVPNGVKKHVLMGADANREQMIHSLEQTTTYRRVKIFFGHGERDALLGEPSKEGNNTEYAGATHGVIYDANLINQVPSSLFAFSCNAGLELGRKFCCTADRNFLGYTDDIPLNVNNEECEKTWGQIVQTISSEIIEDGIILPVHETRLRDLYQEALLYFHQYEGKNNDQSLLMMMYLLHHQNSLCLYKGSS